MKYEAHITFNSELAEPVRRHAGPYWKFSQIHGDPDLGDRLLCYLTARDADEGYLVMRTTDMVKFLRREEGVYALRAKVGHIVFDERYEE